MHERLGFEFHYHKQQRFHYILLTANDDISLAQLSGLRNFDRIIEMNEKNVENIVGWKKLQEEFCSSMNQHPDDPIKFTVLDPKAYDSYKQSNKILSSFSSYRTFVKPIQMKSKFYRYFHYFLPFSLCIVRYIRASFYSSEFVLYRIGW